MRDSFLGIWAAKRLPRRGSAFKQGGCPGVLVQIYLRARRTQRETTWYQGVASSETRVERGWVMQDSFRGI
jgi:hypothetical protein